MLMRQRVGESVGEEMVFVNNENKRTRADGGDTADLEEMPEVIERDDDDTRTRKEMKELILRMTAFRPEERPNANEIIRKLNELSLISHLQ